MPNTSASGGYLTPAGAAPLQDEAFENFLHDLFVGLTGISNELVRPRWQPEPPNQPDFGSDWLAFGIMRQAGDTYGYMEHDSDGDGTDQLTRHESVEILLSSYGPNASGNLSLLRDSLLVEQNRAVMVAAGMGQTETGEIIPAPTLVKDRWMRRFDMTMSFRRSIQRTYPVLTLLSAQGTLNTEAMTTSIDVGPLTP